MLRKTEDKILNKKTYCIFDRNNKSGYDTNSISYPASIINVTGP